MASCRGIPLAGFWSRYRVFLGLYWMTAPLAWLYAIPVERYVSAGDAVNWNLRFLALVSVWRVLLITRVLAVLTGATGKQLIFPVMLFADTVAVTLVSQIDVQIFAVMGGVRLTEAEVALAGAKILVMFGGVLTWPFWLIGSLGVAGTGTKNWSWAPASEKPSTLVFRTVWPFAAASVVVLCLFLPWTQAEQQLRGSVERDFGASRYHAGLATMSAHSRDDFPPHWAPPPSIGSNSERRFILPIVAALSPQTAPWVRKIFLDKMDAALGRSDFPMETLWREAELSRILKVLESQPEGLAILKSKRDLLMRMEYFIDFGDPATGAKNRQDLDSIFLAIAEPPEELTGDLRLQPWADEYSSAWHRYLTILESAADRARVKKLHGPRLQQQLEAKPQLAPDRVLERIRELLEGIDSAEAVEKTP